MVYVATLERIGSPEAAVIYFASITYHIKNALPINISPSQLFSSHDAAGKNVA